MVNDRIKDKLKNLPKDPGVYFHKDKHGEIIYIGKAAVLKNRVRQYFQTSRNRDPKTEALVGEIADLDWMVVESEIDALFLEAEMVRRYLPKYNILLRDDKSSLFVRINYDDPHPTVLFTRSPMDDKAKYFGPYFNGGEVRRAVQYLRKIFPYSTHSPSSIPKRACLQYHLGLCPGIEEGKTSLQDYRANLRKLINYLKGERVQLIKEIERDMKAASKAKDFEAAALLRNQAYALKGLTKQIIFSDKEFLDISKDQGLHGLSELLGLYEQDPKLSHGDEAQGAGEARTEPYPEYGDGALEPGTQRFAPNPDGVFGPDEKPSRMVRRLRRIEGYDISHMQGTDNVASMVVFSNGVPKKDAYRKFKMRIPGNDDFAHMHEAITRRLSEKNRLAWGVPNLFLIDGGKGQLSAAIRARDEAGIATPMIGLAKREEEIVIKSSELRVVSAESEHAQSAANSLLITHDSLLANVAKLGGYIKESDDYYLVSLPHSSHIVKLLQRIRDESHRFAVSYHTVLKVKRQTASLLDDIPTIGPETRKKLLRVFGSMRGIMQARDMELDKAIGIKKAAILRQYLRPLKRAQKIAVSDRVDL